MTHDLGGKGDYKAVRRECFPFKKIYVYTWNKKTEKLY